MAENESLTCPEIQSLFTDGQYTRQALAHIHQCEVCLPFMLDQVLPARDDGSAPPLFAQQVMAQLPNSSESRPGSLGVALVVAASLTATALSFLDLIVPSLSLWGSTLLLAISLQLAFVVLWIAGRTRF